MSELVILHPFGKAALDTVCGSREEKWAFKPSLHQPMPVSWITARQNKFGCWTKIVTQQLETDLEAKHCQWAQSKAEQWHNISLNSCPLQWGAYRAGLPAGVALAGRAMGVKPGDETYTERFLKPMPGWKFSLDWFISQKRLKRVCWRALFILFLKVKSKLTVV